MCEITFHFAFNKWGEMREKSMESSVFTKETVIRGGF
jgi:hypothetical protein